MAFWQKILGLAVLICLFQSSQISVAKELTTQPQDTVTQTDDTEASSGGDEKVVAEVEFRGADIAWMLTCSALVLMMTAPGLALFYGGLVRKKNILSVMMQCVFLMGLMTIVWAVAGFSLAFGGSNPYIGNFDYLFLKDVMPMLASDQVTNVEAELAVANTEAGQAIADLAAAKTQDAKAQSTLVAKKTADRKTELAATLQALRSRVSQNKFAIFTPGEGSDIPFSVFMCFQGMFFVITPALICGAFAERFKFSTMCVFSVLWGLLVYCPICHWVWSDAGWLCEWNEGALFPALDFAGGTVVHISSGVSALVCAIFVGKRIGYGRDPMPPHNLTYTCIGTALLWVGWFGFNAGSALSAGTGAVNAFIATHFAAAGGVVAWSVFEWITRGKPTMLGACSGAVAGLVCITPACGSVSAMSAIMLGLIAGAVCCWACSGMKKLFKYDDSLDAFGVHGVGGTVGAILTGLFATNVITGGRSGMIESGGAIEQLRNQLVSIVASAGLAITGTVLLLILLNLLMGLRVSPEHEQRGLDVTQHDEEGYIFL